MPLADFHVLIPARLASTRLPRKPMADIGGAPMVVRVAQRALRSQAASVTVAADDDIILRACAEHGIAAVLTRTSHASGSDRLAEASELLGLADDAIVVNVQGDEPLIEPDLIDAVAHELHRRPDCVMGTAAHTLEDATEFNSPHVVKVVIDRRHTALYFSRAPIPWWRDGAAPAGLPVAMPTHPPVLRHVGIYSYRVGFLRQFPDWPPVELEQCESLEQLRVLWHGERIAVHVSPHRPGPGVDTPADLARVRALFTGASPV